MKPIIFARVADMYYYNGITNKDVPVNGGAYVNETGEAHECYNFCPVYIGDEEQVCLGFAMLAQTKKDADMHLHIEKIVGSEALKKDKAVHNVIVVFCSKAPNSDTMRVVGFYKNATVYRDHQLAEFPNDDWQEYNFIADKKDCVLLPYQERHKGNRWYVPMSKRRNSSFGFGQSNIWYAQGYQTDEKLYNFLERMIQNIEAYDGANWVERNEMEGPN